MDEVDKQNRTIELQKLRAVSRAFYDQAIKHQAHAFIEFTGLINQWLEFCQQAVDKGIDYQRVNAHVGNVAKDLPVHEFQARYLGQKFGCIFFEWLRDEENKRIFLDAAGLVPKNAHIFVPSQPVQCALPNEITRKTPLPFVQDAEEQLP